MSLKPTFPRRSRKTRIDVLTGAEGFLERVEQTGPGISRSMVRAVLRAMNAEVRSRRTTATCSVNYRRRRCAPPDLDDSDVDAERFNRQLSGSERQRACLLEKGRKSPFSAPARRLLNHRQPRFPPRVEAPFDMANRIQPHIL